MNEVTESKNTRYEVINNNIYEKIGDASDYLIQNGELYHRVSSSEVSEQLANKIVNIFKDMSEDTTKEEKRKVFEDKVLSPIGRICGKTKEEMVELFVASLEKDRMLEEFDEECAKEEEPKNLTGISYTGKGSTEPELFRLEEPVDWTDVTWFEAVLSDGEKDVHGYFTPHYVRPIHSQHIYLTFYITNIDHELTVMLPDSVNSLCGHLYGTFITLNEEDKISLDMALVLIPFDRLKVVTNTVYTVEDLITHTIKRLNNGLASGTLDMALGSDVIALYADMLEKSRNLIHNVRKLDEFKIG